MITKWNREAVLVTVMAVMILIGVFYYGTSYFVEPIQEEAEMITQSVASQKDLLEAYPPTEELQSDYEAKYLETEAYLPIKAQANEELINLERHADQANVSLLSVSRIADRELIENISGNFLKNTYDVQMTSDSPAKFRTLIDRLVNEERIWNITAFTYDKAGDDNYNGTFNFELAYYSTESTSSDVDETVEDEEVSEAE